MVIGGSVCGLEGQAFVVFWGAFVVFWEAFLVFWGAFMVLGGGVIGFLGGGGYGFALLEGGWFCLSAVAPYPVVTQRVA